MTDPLGQSQVIPYLVELSKNGHEFHVLSAEKPDAFQSGKKYIASLLEKYNIHWHPVTYTKRPPVISTIKDIRTLKKHAADLHKAHHFDLCHCRSYIAAFAGLHLKWRSGVPFLFDMRGFFPDERVDGGLWNRKNPVFNQVYTYFKRREKAFLENADHIISLTESGKNVMCEREQLSLQDDDITVIPCCADMNHFNPANIEEAQIRKIRQDTGIAKDDFVLSYLGSLGTWYMTDEMLDFYAELLKQKPQAKFLIITGDNPDIMLKPAKAKNIPTELMIFRSVSRQEVPAMISLSSVSLFFIKPVFSKKASSPTKLAELLAMGIPVICNAGVGDVDRIVEKHDAGLVIQDMQPQSYQTAIKKLDNLMQTNSKNLRHLAADLFSLKMACQTYLSVYKGMIK
ncbi:MAG: glycosyltransferase family 4 protein [Candidatus Delongbacteria bacterium]|nr:glycosyltransferase family 4 protein [Candidatus Delongbacteria bacterium]